MGMNIFEYYGIKEVANVYFEDLESNDIVLYLDTLKVSTVETTAENVSAQGGWGNPKLITWDYGKDINVTLEDAVVSFEELRILLGAKLKEASGNEKVTVHMSSEFIVEVGEGGVKSLKATKKDANDKYIEAPKSGAVKFIDRVNGKRGQEESLAALLTSDKFVAGANDRIVLFWEEERAGGTTDNGAVELTITPNDFPGTFKVVGDAVIRNKDGKDEAFQFVIGKAKMLSEVTLTMQAEGDPSTFNMTLNVLRDDNGEMMKLIKY